MKNHRKHISLDIFGNPVELKILSFDKNCIKIKLNNESTIVNYDVFAEFMLQGNNYLREKRFK